MDWSLKVTLWELVYLYVVLLSRCCWVALCLQCQRRKRSVWLLFVYTSTV